MPSKSLILLPPECYCNNAGQACDSVRPANRPTDLQVFIAHQFDPATAEWASLLKDELTGYGIRVTLPISSKTSGVLFCKLCQQIRQCTAIVSELTALNRNVIFEHGFALGIGCRGVIARKKNRASHSILDALKDIERIEYDNVEDVGAHVAELAASSELEIQPAANGEAKILGEWDLSAYETRLKQVCFLKAGQPNTDSIKRIDKVLRRSAFRSISIDPSEYTTHQLFEYARQIRESFAVVGHFVSDKDSNHEELNALTALLLGLAVGLGKRIAVFQELPIKHQMIDLGGVLHGYERVEDLQTTLEDFLERWAADSDAEHRKLLAPAKKLVIPRFVLDIGNPAAESDDLLTKAFVYTQYTQWAREGQKFLMVGAKGAGKSAIYKYLQEEIEPAAKQSSIFLEFTTFEVRRLMEVAKESIAVHPDLLFRAFWRSNLLVELALEFISAAGPGYKSSKEYLELSRWIDALDIGETTDYYDRFLKVAGISDEDLGSMPRERFVALRFNVAEKWLRELLRGWIFFVYADHLDESWEAGNDLHKAYLTAFVHECFLLSNSIGRSVRPVLFIRDDILAHLRKGEQEADKWNVGKIEWTKPELVQMLEARIKAGFNAPEDSDFSWDTVLPQAFMEQRTIDYLLDRTFLRPRDAIVLMQWIINYAQSEGGLVASEPTIRKALRTFADSRLANLEKEVDIRISDVGQAVRTILPCFSVEWTVPEEEVKDALHAANWPNFTLEDLYTAGALCYVDGEERLMSNRNHTFEVARDLAKAMATEETRTIRFLGIVPVTKKSESHSPAITLHPAFHALVDRLSPPVKFRSEVALRQ